MWDIITAVDLCRKVESVCVPFGCHVALTGGTLYKNGHRKDCDILLYRIRQVDKIDYDGLWIALASIGLTRKSGFGWCFKASFNGNPVDVFFPEDEDGEYEPSDDDSEVDMSSDLEKLDAYLA